MKIQEQETKASENTNVTSLLYIERKCQRIQEWQRLMPAILEISISFQADNPFPLGAPNCPFLIFSLFVSC